MHICFYKYQGCGNDFIMIDNRSGEYNLTVEQIRKLCDRKFGIGADGLIMLNNHEHYAFEVDYSNADGSKSFCGNGARCSVAFARLLGLDCDSVIFLAIDGEHQAKTENGEISVMMQNVISIEEIGKDYTLNTGSPHYVRFVEDIEPVHVVDFGKSIRYAEEFRKEGINVNIVEEQPGNLRVHTYERGVEDETLSCGTGVTAAALAYAYKNERTGTNDICIHTKGGKLNVRFTYEQPHQFMDIWLKGPAEMTFRGEADV